MKTAKEILIMAFSWIKNYLLLFFADLKSKWNNPYERKKLIKYAITILFIFGFLNDDSTFFLTNNPLLEWTYDMSYSGYRTLSLGSVYLSYIGPFPIYVLNPLRTDSFIQAGIRGMIDVLRGIYVRFPDIRKADQDTTKEPIQLITLKNSFEVKKGASEFLVNPSAKYYINARVVAKSNQVDGMNPLSPYDFGLAWGKAAEPRYLINYNFAPGSRILYSSSNQLNDYKLSVRYFARHISNNHVIPANENISKAFLDIKVGDDVIFSGYLVEVRPMYGDSNYKVNGAIWSSSLGRRDAHCEIMYVEKVKVNSKLYT